MSMFGGYKRGSWSIYSKKDPRWNFSGSGRVGMMVCPPDAELRIEELKKILGDPPDDLAYEYMKD